MTIKKSDKDMLVRRDAEGREEFVAWGERQADRLFHIEGAVAFTALNADGPLTVIPRDRIEVTDDVADLGPGWRVRALDTLIDVEVEGTTYVIASRDEPAKVAGLGFHNGRLRLLSAWRVLPETPSEVEALEFALENWESYAHEGRAAAVLHVLDDRGYRLIKHGDA